jgi:hypothetical protein
MGVGNDQYDNGLIWVMPLSDTAHHRDVVWMKLFYEHK